MGILDELTKRIGCAYLSDLPREAGTKSFRRIIMNLSPAEYSLAEWTDAARYLTNRSDLSFSSVAEAQEYLANINASTHKEAVKMP